MKKVILFLFLVLICISTTEAQLLWKITGKNLKHPSYLFGTYHLISIQFLDSIPGLFKAFNESNVIVGEIVMNNIDATAKIQQAAIMPKHIKIDDLLNEEEYKMVDNELKAVLKFGLKDVTIMNPSLILNMYEMEIFKKHTGFTDDIQSDSYFQLVAAEKGKKIVGLESADQQIAVLFGNIDFESKADKLVHAIKHKDSVFNEMLRQDILYKTGKIDELVDLAKDKTKIIKMSEEEYTKYVDNQNANWLTKIPLMMKESSCFIAVDVIHLGGKNGLVKQLQKSGYKAQPVKF